MEINFIIDNFGSKPPYENKAVIELDKSDEVFLHKCRAEKGTDM